MLLPELWTQAAWDEYLAQLAAPPTQFASQRPAPHTPQPPSVASSLDQPLTEAEIEIPLQGLHNGRSGALMGDTSELLRYARLVPTDSDPAPGHLLLPCLHMLFDTAFSSGTVPPPWKTSLVTPIFKKPTTGPLRWASLSVGYMLACWFSAWFSTQSSTASSLPLNQATGHGTAQSTRQLCYSMSLTSTDASSLHSISVLWTSSLPMTGCRGSCYGTFFAGWGFRAPCWPPYRITVLV